MRVFIGLGSNLDNPLARLKTAIEDLQQLPQTVLVCVSSLYRSPPMGPQDQPDYINAVAEVETTLSAHALLDALQQIEHKHGRVRARHWGERTLDLDILLYGDVQISDARLRVPHPGLAERAFVVYPLHEIAPDLHIPGQGSLKALKAGCPRAGLEQVESSL